MTTSNEFYCGNLITGTKYLHSFTDLEYQENPIDTTFAVTKYSLLNKNNLRNSKSKSKFHINAVLQEKCTNLINDLIQQIGLKGEKVKYLIVSINGDGETIKYLADKISISLNSHHIDYLLNKGCCEGLRVVQNVFEQNKGIDTDLCLVNIDAFSSLYKHTTTPHFLYRLFNDNISVKYFHNLPEKRIMWAYYGFKEYVTPSNSKYLYLKSNGDYYIDRKLPSIVVDAFKYFADDDLSLRNGTKHLYLHSGGKKIIHLISTLYPQLEKCLIEAERHFDNYGNMGSCSLDLYLENKYIEGANQIECGRLITFGPGFTALSFELHC